jgi:PilZ domain-containing protein
MKDRRAVARQKVDFNAKLIFVDAARVLDCNVVDMTLDGARLELFAALELPEQIYLWERRANAVFECTVIWRMPGCAGVRFADCCGRNMRLAIVEAWTFAVSLA